VVLLHIIRARVHLSSKGFNVTAKADSLFLLSLSLSRHYRRVGLLSIQDVSYLYVMLRTVLDYKGDSVTNT